MSLNVQILAHLFCGLRWRTLAGLLRRACPLTRKNESGLISMSKHLRLRGMGRIVTPVEIINPLDVSKSLKCDALVDTGAAFMVLPAAWRDRLGKPDRAV